MIVLDWSRPARMLHELLRWLRWIDGWTSTLGGEEMDSGVNGMTMREKCMSTLSLQPCLKLTLWQREFAYPSSSSHFPTDMQCNCIYNATPSLPLLHRPPPAPPFPLTVLQLPHCPLHPRCTPTTPLAPSYRSAKGQ